MSHKSTSQVALPENRVANFVNESTAEHTIEPVLTFVEGFLEGCQNPRLLDVGGGEGSFIDSVLAHMPNAFGTIVEMSERMASINSLSPRKTVVCSEFETWSRTAISQHTSFNLIFFNFVLHHFVDGTIRGSRLLQTAALDKAKQLLDANHGFIVVYEIHYNGWLFRDMPGRFITLLTSSKLLAGIVRRLGANTAGYGVAFHSEEVWLEMFSEVGLRVISSHQISCGEFRGIDQQAKRWLLGIEDMAYQIHFLRPI